MPSAVKCSIGKRLISKTDGLAIYEVSGNTVRLCNDVEFALGGHWLIKKYIPENEVWIEKVIDSQDQCANTLHEIKEVELMKEGLTYDDAHKKASRHELKIRRSGKCKVARR